jgi:hypothetical protein
MVGMIGDTLGATDSWDSLATSAPSSVWERVDPLALQLQFLADSESMGNHDSEPDDWWRID